ncbi:U3 small nucleolar RNA-associated protein 21 homolog [Solanum stenotomum]|uniref:U3 small nucleolar RNA-associated protein 21 homolog n=1 Tax=Solanum stenotomum TaxID=172797 RepID=UPI0020D05474|nr:U3 small nucleolar RNA-associated protein 21 homolog [Solanum stenotomum]
MCFSEDGKWLWDVNLARQIDAIQVDLSITALSLSPNMDILATSHVDQNGVYLWKPEKAPFFLPSIPSLSGEILFKPSEGTNEESDAQNTRLEESSKKTDLPVSKFLQILKSCADKENFAPFTNHIKSLSPSILDMELRMLQIIDDDDEQEPEKRQELHFIELLLDYFIHEISCRSNFEYVQALIRLFLKIHGETVRRQSKLQEKARKLLEVQSAVWQKIDKLFQNTRCMITFLSNSQL